MTTRSHRRTAPALIGLGTGAVMAVVAAVLGPLPAETPEQPDPAAASSAQPTTGTQPTGTGPTGTGPAADAQPPALALSASPPDTPTPAPPPGGKRNPLLPGATGDANPPATKKPAPAAKKPAPGAERVLDLPVLLPGLPPYLPSLLPKLPGPPKAPKPPAVVVPKKPATPGLSGPAAAVVALTNAERAKAGCKPLQVDSRLNRSAQGHSTDMARRDYFEHESPEGEDFADREAEAGFKGRTGGENIAMGQKSAAEVMDDWMHSPGHKRNILDCKFTKIGIGYTPNGHYWTQNFGG